MAQESFRNWQAKSLEQKQSASRLMLGLSAGALAFSTALISDITEYIGSLQSFLFHFHGIVQTASIACGVLFSLNRVRDFDLTAQIARKREINPQDESLKSMRQKVRAWGRITRRLYLAQVITFVIGVVLFLWFVLLRHDVALYSG